MTQSRLGTLHLCYGSLDDPLIHAQVVSYLRGLAAHGYRVHLLTFETRRLSRAERAATRRRLLEQGIRWHALRYHKRPTTAATTLDVVVGALAAGALVWRYRLQVLHARAHVPAAMALPIARLMGRRLLFDVRGLMAEEYEDAGRWSRGSAAFRVTKWVERRALARADAIVVLTHQLKNELVAAFPGRITVIPCCTDVTSFAAAATRRDLIREQLGLSDRTVVLYVGKFTGWYMAEEMVDFFLALAERVDRAHFLVLSQSEQAVIAEAFARRGVSADNFTITSCPRDELPAYLAAADLGLALIRADPSTIACSPTKLGEYLAAGLPVVATAGVGDVDALLADARAGVLIHDTALAGLIAAAEAAAPLIGDLDVRRAARRLAEEELNLETIGIARYVDVYRHLGRAT